MRSNTSRKNEQILTLFPKILHCHYFPASTSRFCSEIARWLRLTGMRREYRIRLHWSRHDQLGMDDRRFSAELPKNIPYVIESNFLLHSQYYAEASNEFAKPISALPGPSNTAPFEEMLQRWQAIGNRVRFDWPKNWTSDLPLQRRTRNRSTNWLVIPSVYLYYDKSN